MKQRQAHVTEPRTNRQRGRQLLLGALILCTWPLMGHGFDMDSDAPIEVSSDRARLDDAEGKATYTGDVVVTQNETRLTADRVLLFRDSEGLRRMEAYGEPATYYSPASANQPPTDAEALTIIYAARENRLTFEEEAVIVQNNDTFRGDLINYDTENRVVNAEGREREDGSRGRVEMTIQPRNEGGDGEQDADDTSDNGNGS